MGDAMRNICPGIIVSLIIVFCFAGTSYGGTNELMKLIQSKEFWSSYKWESLEESALYKTAKWTQTTTDNNFKYYATDMKINDNYTKLILSTDSANNIDRLRVFTIYNTSSSDFPVISYDEIVNWCIMKYGGPQVTYDGTSVIDSESSFTNKTLSWVFNDTVIELDVVYGSTPNKLLPVVINLSYGNKRSIKIKQPAASIHCRVIKFSDKFVNNITTDDLYFTIDEIKNEIRTINNHVTDYLLKASGDMVHLEKSDKSKGATLSLDINRLTGRLEGKSIAAALPESLTITGVCDRYDPFNRKF